MRKCGVTFLLEVFKTCLPEAAISQVEEVSMGGQPSLCHIPNQQLPVSFFDIAAFGSMYCSGLAHRRNPWHAGTCVLHGYITLPL